MRYYLFFLSLCLFAACQTTPTESFTPSGYKYIHHTQNDGATPQVGEEAVFVVDIRNEEKVVNSSRNQPTPAKFVIPDQEQQAANAISPILEALMLMSVGDSLTVMQSTDSFPRKPPGFENSPFVYYDLVLTDINSKEEVEAERNAQIAKMQAAKARQEEVGVLTKDILASYKSNQLGSDLKTTESGLKYYILEEGTGNQITNESVANVHYYGVTTDGEMFDNSFQRGAPIPVPVGRGQVIKGWDEGLQLLKEGSKAFLFIPGELGYGAAGSPPKIGPNAELVFYVEIEQQG